MQLHTDKNIVVLGDINADMTLMLPTYPAEGDDSTVQAIHWGSGGAALNVATTFAILGGRVRLLGRIGSDPAASVALRAAHVAGVDVSLVQQDAHIATGLCSAVVSASGQRTFFSFRGANVFFDPTAITPDVLDGVDLLYVNAHALLEGPQQTAALQAINIAVTQHIPIALDLGAPPARHCRAVILELLPHLWLLCMNEHELHLLLPDQRDSLAFEALQECGAAYVALKRGAQGCLLMSNDQRFTSLPPPVAVVDTNGCGDAFAAGCAWALLHHTHLYECAALANWLGALTATRCGSADALPTRTELAQRLDPALKYLLAFEMPPMRYPQPEA